MKLTDLPRVAAVQDAVTRSHYDVPEREKPHEKRVITFSWVKTTTDDSMNMSVRTDAERAVAESMCLPLVMNGVDVGVALVDQGASRSVMRRSAYD
jgi:hypothetical protein